MKNHSFQKAYFSLILLICLIFTSNALAQGNSNIYQAVINKKVVNLELADTDKKRETGLMYRDYMAPDHGMIFIFDKPQEVAFWMKNVNISLDILFIYKNKVVKIYNSVPGCKSEPCDIYPSVYKIDTVIELNGGYCKKNKIKSGQTVKLDRILQKLITN